MKLFILLISCVAILSAEPEKIDLTVAPTSSTVDSVVIEKPKPKKVHDYRYQIVGGVTMMLFFGLALGTTQSMNPQ